MAINVMVIMNVLRDDPVIKKMELFSGAYFVGRGRGKAFKQGLNEIALRPRDDLADHGIGWIAIDPGIHDAR